MEKPKTDLNKVILKCNELYQRLKPNILIDVLQVHKEQIILIESLTEYIQYLDDLIEQSMNQNKQVIRKISSIDIALLNLNNKFIKHEHPSVSHSKVKFVEGELAVLKKSIEEIKQSIITNKKLISTKLVDSDNNDTISKENIESNDTIQEYRAVLEDNSEASDDDY